MVVVHHERCEASQLGEVVDCSNVISADVDAPILVIRALHILHDLDLIVPDIQVELSDWVDVLRALLKQIRCHSHIYQLVYKC